MARLITYPANAHGFTKQKRLNNLSQRAIKNITKGDNVYIQHEAYPLLIILLFFKNTGCLKKTEVLNNNIVN